MTVANGRLTSSERPDAGDTYRELLARNHMSDAEALGTWRPPPLDTPHGLLTSVRSSPRSPSTPSSASSASAG